MSEQQGELRRVSGIPTASNTLPATGECNAFFADSTRRMVSTSLKRDVSSDGTSVVVLAWSSPSVSIKTCWYLFTVGHPSRPERSADAKTCHQRRQ